MTYREIAERLMAHAKANYCNPTEDWSGMVECQSVAEIAENLERDGVTDYAEAFEIERRVAAILADRGDDARNSAF